MLWRCAEHGALGELGSGWGDWAGVRFDLGCVSAQQRAAADAIPATVRSPAAPPSLLNTAIAALWVQGHLDYEGALDLIPGLGALDERHSGRPDFINRTTQRRPKPARAPELVRIRPHLIRGVLLECDGFAIARGVGYAESVPCTILGEPR
jgi:hypothetical protein